jgi:hypothetical protein
MLALLGHVILGVFREISHRHSLFDLGGKLVVEFVLKKRDLGKNLLFYVFGHPGSVAASGVCAFRER